MIIGQNGINWIGFIDTETGRRWREHKFDRDRFPNPTKPDAWMAAWTDEQGRSGCDIKHYEKTGEVIRYEKTHIRLQDGRIIKFSA